MDRKKSILILLSFLLNIGIIQAQESGFDEVCRIYTEAKNSSLVKQQLDEYLNDNVTKRVKDKDALALHNAIPKVSPSERYKIFKESVEMSLKKPWDCAAMKALMK